MIEPFSILTIIAFSELAIGVGWLAFAAVVGALVFVAARKISQMYPQVKAQDRITRQPMDPQDYYPGDWTYSEIDAAKALWDAHNPHKTVLQLHPRIADAWMRYLSDARIVFSVLKPRS